MHLLLVIHRRRRTALLRVVARATVGVIALLAALLSFPLLVSDLDQPEALWRTVWVVVILDLLGTVVIPLSNALFNPRRDAGAATATAVWPTASPTWSGAPAPSPVSDALPVRVDGDAAPGPWSDDVRTGRVDVEDARRRAAVSVDDRSNAAVDVDTGVTVPADVVYERRPEASRALAWPRYVDGTPLPARADGSPDFSGVTRR